MRISLADLFEHLNRLKERDVKELLDKDLAKFIIERLSEATGVEFPGM